MLSDFFQDAEVNGFLTVVDIFEEVFENFDVFLVGGGQFVVVGVELWVLGVSVVAVDPGLECFDSFSGTFWAI